MKLENMGTILEFELPLFIKIAILIADLINIKFRFIASKRGLLKGWFKYGIFGFLSFHYTKKLFFGGHGHHDHGHHGHEEHGSHGHEAKSHH